MDELLETILANALGTAREASLHGRRYLVAPAAMIVPGVLNGSKGPLYYSPAQVARNPGDWNGIPIVVNHPVKNGTPVTARRPDVLEESGIGSVFAATYNGKLAGEAWFDVDRTAAYDAKHDTTILSDLRAGRPIELSTGLFTTETAVENGKCPATGRAYTHEASNFRPDHLAVLPFDKGACSRQDGCGINVNKAGDAAVEHDVDEHDVCVNCGGPGGKPGPCPSGGGAHPTPEAAAAHLHVLAGQWVAASAAGKTPTGDEMRTAVGAAMGDHSPHAVAAAMGYKSKFKNAAAALQAVHRLTVGRVGSFARSDNSTANNDSTQGDDTVFNKSEAVAFLTANCTCWKGKEAVLNGMDDDTLKGITADAREKFKPPTPAPVPTGNAEQHAEWWKTAPPDVKVAVMNVMRTDAKNKVIHADKITANYLADRRAKSAEILAAKLSTEDLDFIAGAVPAPQPTGLTGNAALDTLALGFKAPNWMAAGSYAPPITPTGNATGGPDAPLTGNADADLDMLNAGVWNWQEMSGMKLANVG